MSKRCQLEPSYYRSAFGSLCSGSTSGAMQLFWIPIFGVLAYIVSLLIVGLIQFVGGDSSDIVLSSQGEGINLAITDGFNNVSDLVIYGHHFSIPVVAFIVGSIIGLIVMLRKG